MRVRQKFNGTQKEYDRKKPDIDVTTVKCIWWEPVAAVIWVESPVPQNRTVKAHRNVYGERMNEDQE